jgi:hypothetical protein
MGTTLNHFTKKVAFRELFNLSSNIKVLVITLTITRIVIQWAVSMGSTTVGVWTAYASSSRNICQGYNVHLRCFMIYIHCILLYVRRRYIVGIKRTISVSSSLMTSLSTWSAGIVAGRWRIVAWLHCRLRKINYCNSRRKPEGSRLFVTEN